MITTRLQILVVDDDSAVMELLAEYLRACGHDVTALSDGEAALKALEDGDYDVVLSDLRMPGVDGLSLLEAAQPRWPGIAFVLMSGHGNLEMAIRAMKAGAADFLLKPFKLAAVHEALLRAVERSRRAQRTVQLQGVVELMQATRGATERGLRDLLRYTCQLVVSDYEAAGAMVAFQEPALRRWVERYRSAAQPFAGLDLDALGAALEAETTPATPWFGEPGAALLVAPIFVQLDAKRRPAVKGALVVASPRAEASAAQAGLGVYAGVLGDALSRLALASQAKALGAPPRPGAPPRYGLSVTDVEHRARVEQLIEPAMRTMDFTAAERAAIGHALNAWTSGQPLAPVQRDPRAINERLDPEAASHASSILLHIGERFDGQGSPAGVAGRAIPLTASLLAIGDWWAQVTGSGELRAPMSPEEARANLEADRGQRFNPQVVAIFLRHVTPNARSEDTMLPFEMEDDVETAKQAAAEPDKRAPWFSRRR